MAKLRNRSDDTLETRVSGRTYTTAPDALLDLPDDVYLAHAWPETLWTEVDVPRPADVDDTIDAVKAQVGADPALAQAALDAENSKDKPRSTLVAWLETVIDDNQEG